MTGFQPLTDTPEGEPPRYPSPPMRPMADWNAGRALLYFAIAAAMSLLLGAGLIGLIGFYWSIVIAELVAFGLLPWLLSRVFATGWEEWISAPRISSAFWGWSLLAVIGFAIVQSNLPVALDRLFPMPAEQFEMYRRYLSAATPGEFLLFVMVAAIVPAFCEEITFRGIIQRGLRRSYGPKHAVVWTGFLFALLHMNPWNFLGLWAFGTLLGYLVERTGSIRPAILVHLLNNTLALGVFAFQQQEDWETPLEFIPWYWTLLAGAVMVVALMRLHRIRPEPKDGTSRDRVTSFE